MAFDALPETQAILDRLAVLEGGRILDGIPDDAWLARNPTYTVKPYIVVEFGELVVTYAQRSIMGETQQPYVMPITITCFGATAKICRETAAAVRTLIIGWAPSTTGNATPIRISGGGQFSQRDSAGAPSRFRRVIFAETTLNMSVVTS